MNTRDLSKLIGARFEREVTLDTRSVNADDRTVQAALSSEIPVARFYGNEVLVHSPEAVDLSRAADGLPMLWQHNADQPIGVVDNVRLKDGKLRGLLRFSNNSKATEIFQDVKEGFLRNISVGYQVNRWEEQANSDTVRVTGWTLLEASVVTVPADASVGINRSLPGAKSMTDETQPADVGAMETAPVVDLSKMKREYSIAKKAGAVEAIKGERQRVSAIHDLFNLGIVPRNDFYEGLRARAIDEGWTLEASSRILMEVMSGETEPAIDYGRVTDDRTGNRAQAATHEGRLPPVVIPAKPGNQARALGTTLMGEDALDKFKAGASHALLVKAGVLNSRDDTIKAREGGMVGMSLVRMAEQYLRVMNVNTSSLSDEEMAGRAFTAKREGGMGMTTSDFTNILANVANKALLQGWDEAPETWPLWTRRGQLPDFKKADRSGLSGFTGLDEIAEDGEIKYGKFTDRKEQIQLVEYAKKFRLSRRTIINDDLQAFTQVPRLMGRAANRKVGDIVYSKLDNTGPTLNQDSTALFDASTHKNYTASTGAPSTTTLAVVYKAMALQTDPNSGAVLNIVPSFMIVPKALEPTGLELQNNVYDPAGTAGTLKQNAYANRFKVIADGRMDGLTNGTTAWVMAADPNIFDTIEVAFLNGVAEPYLREEQEWDTRGVEYVVGIDFGVAVLDFRGMYRYKGA